MTIFTGLFYTLFVTVIGRTLFPSKVGGSLVSDNGKLRGSALIGQKSDSSAYFWSRPSAVDYNPVPSGASNLGPVSRALRKTVTERRRKFAEVNSVPDSVAIPAEMIFASASGLDPHISPAAAIMQAGRIVKARNFTEDQHKRLLLLIGKMTENPQFNILGEPRINVFLLNLSLDRMK